MVTARFVTPLAVAPVAFPGPHGELASVGPPLDAAVVALLDEVVVVVVLWPDELVRDPHPVATRPNTTASTGQRFCISPPVVQTPTGAAGAASREQERVSIRARPCRRVAPRASRGTISR